MTEGKEILVTGASGTTGGLVARFLRERGVGVRAASRRSNGFDWTDPATFPASVRGIERVYLVAPVGVADPARYVDPFLTAALAAGVRRVVALSSSAVAEGDPVLGEVHRLVRTRMPEWTVLRPAWFMQNFTGDHLVGKGIRERREIVTATGAGRVPFVDAADIAAVAGHALLDADAHDTEHVITGPAALSYAEAASVVAEVAGVPVRHRDVSAAELTAMIIGFGLAEDFARVLAALDADIRAGRQEQVTNVVREVTGRAPRSFRDFAAANADAFR